MLNRRAFMGGLAAAGVLPRFARAARGPKPTNVLVFCSDEHNPRLMGAHPLVRTPRLDAFAAEGVQCPRAYASAPVCAPTRQSWLTGLEPWEHGQLGNNFVLDPRNRSLVEAFRAAGYQTACFGKLHTWSPEVDGAFGFDTVVNEENEELWRAIKSARRVSREAPEYDPVDAELFATMPQAGRFQGKVRPDTSTCDSWVVVQEALDHLRGRPKDQPFFLYVGVRMPHYPFDLPAEWYHRRDPADMPGPIGPPASASPGTARQSRQNGFDGMTAEHHRLLQARYYAAIEYTDHLFGEVLDELEVQGLSQDTLVAYMSDHGDMAGERGCWLKHTMFDSSVRVPLMLRGAGLKPSIHQGLVSHVDVLRTLGGLVGVDTGGKGQDLSAALREGRGGRERAFATDFIDPKTGRASMALITDGELKLTRYSGPFFKERLELFHLGEDPQELVDRATDEGLASRRDALLVELGQWEAGLTACPFPLTKKG